MIYEVNIDGETFRLELSLVDGSWHGRLDGREMEVDAVLVQPGVLSLRIGTRTYEVKSEHVGNDWHVWVGEDRFAAEVRDPRSLRERSRSGQDQGPKKILAPMPGKVVRLIVQEGDEVELGAGILVVEAMKMQNEIKSPKKGKVQKLMVRQGAAVNAGDVMAIVE